MKINRKTITITTVGASLGLFAVAVGAYHGHGAAQPFTCPVTKLKVPSKKDAAAKSVYKGKTYYFCTTHCKQLFDKSPAKYAKLAAGH